MSKCVQEIPFKFFLTYEDALANSNYILELVEFEGSIPPDIFRSKNETDFFLLKNFSRQNGGDRFIESVYIKQ